MTIKIKNYQDQVNPIFLDEKATKDNLSLDHHHYYSSIPSLSNFIYVTDSYESIEVKENSVKTGVTEIDIIENEVNLSDSFPLFFQNANIIYIPKKSKRHLERIPLSYLKRIDKDKRIGIEKCLLLLSSLSSTVYSDVRSKQLSSRIMDYQTRKGNDNTRIYPKVIEALKYESSTTEPIIQVKTNSQGIESYQEGVACKSYSLTNTYYEAGLIEYEIKTPEILSKRKKQLFDLLKKAQENVICKNLIGLYSKIDLPSEEDLFIEAKRLVKIKYTNKKGKRLTFLNKHPKSYFEDGSLRSFVEDDIQLFQYLTKNNYRIPTIGCYKSGGRVVDSFVLMPSWIRRHTKIDGEFIVEVDFKALHPNIAMSIYRGSKQFLTHDLVAEESNIPKNIVKIEHLSFFNETLGGMKRNPLYQYYKEAEPEMLQIIEEEKRNSKFKHKITSMKMFAKEVQIMTECIKELNARGIYVGYVYDALFCKVSQVEIVKEVMDKIVMECEVYTTASINY